MKYNLKVLLRPDVWPDVEKYLLERLKVNADVCTKSPDVDAIRKAQGAHYELRKLFKLKEELE